MKRFISGTLFFLLPLTAIVVGINCWFWRIDIPEKELDFFNRYEDARIVYKLNRYILSGSLKDNDNLFVGSSTTYNHLNPVWFDSLMNDGRTSYNISQGGYFPFRTLDMIALANRFKPVKRINYFLELRGLSDVNHNCKSRPILYSMSWKKYRIALDYIGRLQSLSFFEKSKWMGAYTLSLITKYLNPGFMSRPIHKEPDSNVSDSLRGFYALERRAGATLKPGYEEDSQNRIVFDPEPAAGEYEKMSGSIQHDKFFAYLLSEAQKLKNTGSDVVFFIPPRSKNTLVKCYEERLLANGFPVIDLSGSGKHPEFYALEYSYDKWHLNRKGALLFTEKLAREYKRIRSSSP